MLHAVIGPGQFYWNRWDDSNRLHCDRNQPQHQERQLSSIFLKKQNRSTQAISDTFPIFSTTPVAFNHIKRIMIVLMQWDFWFFRFWIMCSNLGTAAIISMVWCVNARKVKQTMINSTMPLLHQFFCAVSIPVPGNTNCYRSSFVGCTNSLVLILDCSTLNKQKESI